jgi:hypothetical protein
MVKLSLIKVGKLGKYFIDLKSIYDKSSYLMFFNCGSPLNHSQAIIGK